MLQIALFCRVIDNFGDIGVCWRLARQLQHKHGAQLTLWVDDLPSFARLCPQLDPTLPAQNVDGITVCLWRDDADAAAWQDFVADIVIEGFGCRLPDALLPRLRSLRPHWVNLEYLSAEDWVAGCHRLRSPDAQTSKYFFFPGFSADTGGVTIEDGLEAARQHFLKTPAVRAQWYAQLGLGSAVAALLEDAACLKVFTFVYPDAQLAQLFDLWQAQPQPVLCLLPAGVARTVAEQFLQAPALPGSMRQQGSLTVQILPFVPQPQFDRLLWQADLALVRGEDSFVRAQLAACPLVWQIYRQDDDAHLDKLRAFLDCYLQGAQTELAASVAQFWQIWNRPPASATAFAAAWQALQTALPAWRAHAQQWQAQLMRNGDLSSNLLQFLNEIG